MHIYMEKSHPADGRLLCRLGHGRLRILLAAGGRFSNSQARYFRGQGLAVSVKH